MDVKLFQRTQRDLAATINLVINNYWEDEIDEQEMMNLIKKLYELNRSKMVKGGTYTTIIHQQCGENRLEVVSSILQLNEKAENHPYLFRNQTIKVNNTLIETRCQL